MMSGFWGIGGELGGVRKLLLISHIYLAIR